MPNSESDDHALVEVWRCMITVPGTEFRIIRLPDKEYQLRIFDHDENIVSAVNQLFPTALDAIEAVANLLIAMTEDPDTRAQMEGL